MNYSSGIVAAFFTLACWTVGTFAFTRASQLSGPLAVNRVRLLYACVLLTLLVCFMDRISVASLFSTPTTEQWIWLGVSGIVGLSVGDFFAFTAYRMMGSSRASLFHTFGPASALLFGFFLLGESINIIGVAGMLVSAAGLAWFVATNSHGSMREGITRSEMMQGMLFAALAAVTQGVGLALSKKGMVAPAAQQISPVHATWIRIFIATTVMYVSGIFKTNLWKEFTFVSGSAERLKPLLTGTLFGPVMGVSLSLFAARQLEVSIAQTIFSLLPISVISVAMLSGREKPGASSLIAAIIGVCGVFILVWRNELMALFY